MSRFAPVWLPPELEIKGRVSATFTRFFNSCRRSGFLYQKYRRAPLSTDFLERGSALHRVLELATMTAVAQGEDYIPPELVKAIVNEVLADPAYHCPVEEHDYIRESAYRWASQTLIRPNEIAAIETLFELELGPIVFRCKIDRAEIFENGTRALVHDYKSGRNLPQQEDVGRKRDDGTVAAKDVQLVLYALALVFGYPIRVSPCSTCAGGGRLAIDGEGPFTCPTCKGRGEVEKREPFRLGERVQHVDAAYVFPGIIGVGGLMGERGASLTVLELHEYLESFKAIAEQIVKAQETGDWPASYGAHCTQCPCQAECPIAPDLRRFAGTINSREDAAQAAEDWAAAQLHHKAMRSEILNWIKSQPNGQDFLIYGRDQIIERVRGTSTSVDRDGLIEASRRQAQFGEPFDERDFIKEKPSVTVKDRALTEAELERLARRDGDHDGRRDEGPAGDGAGELDGAAGAGGSEVG